MTPPLHCQAFSEYPYKLILKNMNKDSFILKLCRRYGLEGVAVTETLMKRRRISHERRSLIPSILNSSSAVFRPNKTRAGPHPLSRRNIDGNYAYRYQSRSGQ